MAILVNFAALEQANDDVARVKAKFEQEISTLIKIVEETTENDWKGPDATLFVNSTKEKISKIHTEYDDFLQKLGQVIMADHDKFKETQQANMSQES